MAKMGRPNRITPEDLRKLEEAFAIGASVQEALFYADLPASTYYDYVRDHKDFSDKIDRLKQKPILKARREVVNGIDGNPEFALKYLSKVKKDEFADRQEIGIPEGTKIRVIIGDDDE